MIKHKSTYSFHETVARVHALAMELFKDIECGNLDAQNFCGNVEVETFAARLYNLYVQYRDYVVIVCGDTGIYIQYSVRLFSVSHVARSGIIQRSSSYDIAAREYRSKFVIGPTHFHRSRYISCVFLLCILPRFLTWINMYACSASRSQARASVLKISRHGCWRFR